MKFPKVNDPRGAAVAEDWLAYIHSGDTSAEGHRAFEQWISADSAHAVAYRRVEQIWRDLSGVSILTDVDAAAYDSSTSQVGRNRWKPAAGALAASALFVALFLSLWGAGETQHYKTPIAQVETFSLQDGSQLTLGARSNVKVRFTDQRRQLELLAGELFLDVEPDLTRPFIVKTNTLQVRVTGTQFDVRRTPAGTRVSVLEGSVAVSSEGSQALQLRAGQGVSGNRSGDLSAVNELEKNRIAAWREGRLVYSDATLEDIIFDVNRHRKTPIRLSDDSLGDIRITAAFRTDQINDMLFLLQATQPVRIDRSRSNEWLLQRRY